MQQPHGHPISLDDLAGRLTITVPEAGQLLGCSRANAYQAARDGVIPTLQLGRRLVVPVPKFLELCGATQNAEAPGT